MQSIAYKTHLRGLSPLTTFLPFQLSFVSSSIMLCKKSIIRHKLTILLLFNTTLLLYLLIKTPDKYELLECKSQPSLDSYKFMVNKSYEDKKILIFNRVPKTGSTTMVNKLDELKDENNFIRGHIATMGKVLPIEVQRGVIKDMRNTFAKARHKKAAFAGHFYFMDFKNEDQVWFSIIRDPVEKFISAFCYNRDNHFDAGWLVGIDFPIPDGVSKEEFVDKNLQECIQKGDLECQIIQGQKYDHSIVSLII